MSLKQRIQEHIDHVKERQQYWKEEKDIAKIWAGIESELTLVLRDLDEAAKQIRVVTEDFHKALHRRALDLDSPTRALIHGVISAQGKEVLAVLEGETMNEREPLICNCKCWECPFNVKRECHISLEEWQKQRIMKEAKP